MLAAADAGSTKSLTRGAVDLWSIELDLPDDCIPPLAELLDAGERARSRTLVSLRLRRRFVVAHASVRQILSQYLDVPPQAITYNRMPGGKPEVAGASIAFNLAHSDGLAVCAVGARGRLGVDIEAVRVVPDADEIVTRYFAPSEVREYLRLPPSARARAFFVLWTRKEALIKATGEGLRRPLDSFHVGVDPAARRLAVDEEALECWEVQSFEPRAGYLGAIACDERIAVQPRCWRDEGRAEGGGPLGGA